MVEMTVKDYQKRLREVLKWSFVGQLDILDVETDARIREECNRDMAVIRRKLNNLGVNWISLKKFARKYRKIGEKQLAVIEKMTRVELKYPRWIRSKVAA